MGGSGIRTASYDYDFAMQISDVLIRIELWTVCPEHRQDKGAIVKYVLNLEICCWERKAVDG
jgi:hypothetical protein